MFFHHHNVGAKRWSLGSGNYYVYIKIDMKFVPAMFYSAKCKSEIGTKKYVLV